MSTAMHSYENQERTYPSHVLMGVIQDQTREHKDTNRGIIETIKYLVKLMSKAQVAPEMNA